MINNKIVVFDLDETLGCFIELGMFWNSLENFYGYKLSDNEFNKLLDIFSDFLRPDTNGVMSPPSIELLLLEFSSLISPLLISGTVLIIGSTLSTD